MTVSMLKDVTYVIRITETINGDIAEEYTFETDNGAAAKRIAHYESERYRTGYIDSPQFIKGTNYRTWLYRKSDKLNLYTVSVTLEVTKN